MLQNLLLTDHMTTPGIKEIYKVNGGGGGEGVFARKQNIPEKQDKSKKNKPKAQLAHTYICSMTSFRNTPSTSATYSSRLVPFPPANGPNVLT